MTEIPGFYKLQFKKSSNLTWVSIIISPALSDLFLSLYERYYKTSTVRKLSNINDYGFDRLEITFYDESDEAEFIMKESL